MLKNRGKTIIISLLLIIELSLIFVGTAIIGRNTNNMVLKSLYDENAKYLPYYIERYSSKDVFNKNDLSIMTDDRVKELKKAAIIDDYNVVYDYFYGAYSNINYDDNIYPYINGTDIPKVINNGVLEISDDFIKNYSMSLYGRLPNNYDEIVITKFIFEQYRLRGYYSNKEITNIYSYDDLIGKELQITDTKIQATKNVKIVGILDTGFDVEKYNDLIDKKPYKSKKLLELNKALDDILLHGIENVYYVKEGFMEEVLINSVDKVVLSNNDNNTVSFNKVASIKTSDKKIYYFGEKNTTNGIVLPLPSSSNEYLELLEIAKRYVTNFATEHYEEIRNAFVEDGNNDSVSSYVEYIIDSKENKYHKEYNYATIKDKVLNDYIKTLVQENDNSVNFNELLFDHYVKVIGFYNQYDDVDNTPTLYISDDLRSEILHSNNKYRIDRYNLFITKLTYDYETDINHISVQNFDINRLEDASNRSGYREVYKVGLGMTSSLNLLNRKLNVLSYVIIGIVIILAIIIVILLNNYNRLIRKEKHSVLITNLILLGITYLVSTIIYILIAVICNCLVTQRGFHFDIFGFSIVYFMIVLLGAILLNGMGIIFSTINNKQQKEN